MSNHAKSLYVWLRNAALPLVVLAVRVMSAQGSPGVTITSDVLPVTAALTLSGRQVTLPAPHRLTLIISGTGQQGSAANAWWDQVSSICARHPVLDCYRTTFGSNLPAATLKHFVPVIAWDRFAIVSPHQSKWRQTLDAGAQASVRAVLLAPDGGVLWSAAGRSSDPLPLSLEEALLAASY